MISRDELKAQAEAFDLNESDIQRDYVFGWLISGVFQATKLGETVALKGGNALRKGYFPSTRFSDDLDFTTTQGLDSATLLRDLNEVCRFTEAATGVRFDVDRNRIADVQQIDEKKRAYKINLYFKDFMTGVDHITLKVRVDVAEYDRLYLPVQTRHLIHPYSDLDRCGTTIRCVKLEEALADKLKCLLQRRYCYDLFDLVYGTFVNGDIAVNRVELIEVFLKKTIFQNSPAAAKSLLLDLPVDLFRGYWSKVVCPIGSRMSFENAVERLKDGVEALFAPFGHGAHLADAFYPSHLRNPILQAGSERRVINLKYHGVQREVEPYSLAYKRRTDGIAQEYFYAYDRTGGRSGPGIKAFLQGDIEQLEVTNEIFEPRFSVELSKAGDSSTSGYFSQSGSWVRNTPSRAGRLRTRTRRVRSGILYVVECSYCGKQFRRSSHTTRLNSHKDRYGNQCYGRSGFIVRIG